MTTRFQESSGDKNDLFRGGLLFHASNHVSEFFFLLQLVKGLNRGKRGVNFDSFPIALTQSTSVSLLMPIRKQEVLI